jgi:hypothetical protein
MMRKINSVTRQASRQRSGRPARRAALTSRSVRDDRRRRDSTGGTYEVQVRAENGRVATLLGSDVTATGMRLIGPRSLIGQKLEVTIPRDGPGKCVLVRVVWSRLVSDGLWENGGAVLELVVTPSVNGGRVGSRATR